ncbi:sensor histidine kinase [Marinihelvus fidelis]|nr:ATP-binding protein [Marinihelvus fidelis]
MAIENKRLRRRLFRVAPVLAALLVLLVSLVLVSDVPEDAGGYNRVYLWVLVLTIVALALLALAIVSRFVALYRNVRAEVPGARLSARWVRNFLVMSLPPALIVYFVSAWFLSKTVDSWFDVEVESALADSLRLGKEFLDRRTFEARGQVRQLGNAIDMADDDNDAIRRVLLDSVRAAGPVELSVLSANGRIEASAAFDPLASLPDRPGDYALLQARERGEYAAAEPGADGSLTIRVLQRLPDTGSGGGVYLLQALYPLPETISALTSNIEQEYHRYQNIAYLRGWLKQSFLLILSLVLGLTVLLAILAALTAARRMVAPISSLALATRRVASGDLGQAVETGGRDEIGFLAQSFNEMTEALLRASDEAESSRARLQAQGEYLETVLGSLSAGVFSLDGEGRLVRVNRAAEKILGLPAGASVGQPLAKLAAGGTDLQPLTDTIGRHLGRGHGGWQEEILLERDGRPLVLLARGSRLASTESNDGHVVVFDDVTVLNRAQRDAAWAEVARRLAHEVKNPLTPIRLAAERLRMKLMDRLDGRDAEMLDRSATTIVAQVEALRKLVDAFGDYAREPDLERVPVRLDRLVNNVVELYRQGDPGLVIELDMCEGPEGLSADAGQLRQLLHNLIRNAIEANVDGRPTRIGIRTRVIDDDDEARLELRVDDNGPGFPDSVLAQPFEPYVTHKPNGSGLGLAICRKIIDDHDGTIAIVNHDGGARAVITLPLAPETVS